MSDRLAAAWSVLETLSDPEIPVITLRELGILREIREVGETVEVIITPTYSGCPAMSQIEDDVRSTLDQAGIPATVVTRLAPAWTTDWMTEEGKAKLNAYGIAPPQRRAVTSSVVSFMARPQAGDVVPCPHCGSTRTSETSHFGSTACKALYRCLDCREPFDYFKPY